MIVLKIEYLHIYTCAAFKNNTPLNDALQRETVFFCYKSVRAILQFLEFSQTSFITTQKLEAYFCKRLPEQKDESWQLICDIRHFFITFGCMINYSQVPMKYIYRAQSY